MIQWLPTPAIAWKGLRQMVRSWRGPSQFVCLSLALGDLNIYLMQCLMLRSK